MTDLTVDRLVKIGHVQDLFIPFCVDQRGDHLEAEVAQVCCESSGRSLSRTNKFKDSSAVALQKAIHLAVEVIALSLAWEVFPPTYCLTFYLSGSHDFLS